MLHSIIILKKERKYMEYSDELLENIKIDSIKNLEEKKIVAKKVVDKVKDGQVIRIWFWIYIIFSCISYS